MNKETYTRQEVELMIEKSFNSGYQYAYYSQIIGKIDIKSKVDELISKFLKKSKKSFAISK